MTDDTIIKLMQPGSFEDPLTEVLRNGARALLAQAVEAEVAAVLGRHTDLRTEDGRARIVRHGHLPEREILTGLGPLAVRQPRVRDRGAAAGDPERIRFSSALLPPYARRTKSLDVLLPILYLRGLSTGDFQEALAALLGKDAPGLSASTISRLKEMWSDEHDRWRKARPGSPTLCLRLGGWHLSASPAGRREAVHSRADRRDRGRQEGVDRFHRWRSREHAGLARVAARPEASRIGRAAQAGHRRWRARLLEGACRAVADDCRAALLGALCRPADYAEQRLDVGSGGGERCDGGGIITTI